jgi:hypothetical protein
MGRRVSMVLFLVVAVSREASAQTSSHPGLRDLPAERPVRVEIAAYLIDFVRVDEENLIYTLDGYLTLEWKDPRLSLQAAPALDRAGVTLGQIWSPNIELMNQHSPRQIANTQITLDPEGRVKYEERFTVDLAAELNLRRFPFDEQTLPLQIESFRFGQDELVFVPRAGREMRSPSAFLPDWDILDASDRFDADDYNPDRRPYSRHSFEIRVRRKVGYYVWNVFLPIALITALSWTSFWVTPADLQTRMNIGLTAMLTAIAFSLVIAGNRPRVSYMTFMDGVCLASYGLIFLVMVETILAHGSVRRGDTDRAEWLSRAARMVFPAVAVVSVLLLTALFFLTDR